MTREEISLEVYNLRIKLNISKYKVSKLSGLAELQIGRIDNALHSYSIGSLFKYLNAISGCIKLFSEHHNEQFVLKNRQDFIRAFKKMRELNGLSQAKAASMIGVNTAIITGIESRDVDTSIDKFLQCIYGLGYQVKIEKL